MNPNRHAFIDGKITDEHFDTLVKVFQAVARLKVDGICGPKTRAALDARAHADAKPILEALPEIEIRDGLMYGDNVRQILSHPSWYPYRTRGAPKAIVAHYTSTNGGAENMARRRLDQHDHFAPHDDDDRWASWHVTVDRDGSIIQQIPLTAGAYHCKGNIPGLGRTNKIAVGIELIGHGKRFPPAQVEGAARVWRAIAVAYPELLRSLAMLPHSVLDPRRRSDPGPVWMSRYAEVVLDYAYGSAG